MLHFPSPRLTFRLLASLFAGLLFTASASADPPTNSASHPQPPKPGSATNGAKPVLGGSTSMTTAEFAEINAARDAALKANPDLVRVSAELAARLRDFQQKLDDAMIQANPSVAPVIAKLEHNRTAPPGPPSPHPTNPAASSIQPTPSAHANANPPPSTIPLPVNVGLPPNLSPPPSNAPAPRPSLEVLC